MPDANSDSSELHSLLARLRDGDTAARDELIHTVCRHLERLARKMLQRYPRVHRWEETGDVLQNALVRLLRALQTVKPESTRAFYGLAAEQIRRELIDLARHYYGPQGLGANYDSHKLCPDAGPAPDKTDEEDPEELERWRRFHEEVENLPPEEREVVSLRFYHGWKEKDIAELLQVDERTIRRRWRSASSRLVDALGGELP